MSERRKAEKINSRVFAKVKDLPVPKKGDFSSQELKNRAPTGMKWIETRKNVG